MTNAIPPFDNLSNPHQCLLGSVHYSASEPPNLTEAGKLGHFLKGSSAAIGVDKVKNICEKIQHWGALKDPIDATPISAGTATSLITQHLRQARSDFKTAKIVLERVISLQRKIRNEKPIDHLYICS